ncbi:MAG TPA: hypothetical protein DF712_05310, partial [Balneola sp.]|nr:hypothetical protein [Balneola sp.]
MTDLGKWIVDQIVTEGAVKKQNGIKKVIGIYPGRFQPMGKHHAEVYKKLASKYGKSNTYIATSDKVALPKSPLNFREKLQVIRKHGIQNVVQVKNPYKAEEITKKYDPTTTAVLFAVGKKDMMENPRFKVGTKKNGEPGYFQHYDKNKNNLQPFTQHGYLVVAPHVSMKIPGYGEMSGTVLRQVLATADQNTFRNIMGWFDPKIFNLLKDKLSQNIKEFLVTSNMSNILNEISKADGSKADVDDGPRYFYGNQATYRKKTADMAKRLGFEVINYIIKDN